MKPMRFFVDTHSQDSETFPAGLTKEQFEVFYTAYEKACMEENVVPLRIHLSYEEARAFCFTMAADAAAVQRAHEKVGLPFDSITEVTTVTPGDTFFQRRDA
ncbi:MAG: nickel-binding protein [Candidatus Thiodiazotropha sp. 6PLUC2]